MGVLAVLALKVGGNRDVLVQMIGFQVLFNVLASGIVSWQGHLGGFVGGLLVGAAMVYAPRTGRRSLPVGRHRRGRRARPGRDRPARRPSWPSSSLLSQAGEVVHSWGQPCGELHRCKTIRSVVNRKLARSTEISG